MPILNSAYFTECRFVIRHITQTDTEKRKLRLILHTAPSESENIKEQATNIKEDFRFSLTFTNFMCLYIEKIYLLYLGN